MWSKVTHHPLVLIIFVTVLGTGVANFVDAVSPVPPTVQLSWSTGEHTNTTSDGSNVMVLGEHGATITARAFRAGPYDRLVITTPHPRRIRVKELAKQGHPLTAGPVVGRHYVAAMLEFAEQHTGSVCAELYQADRVIASKCVRVMRGDDVSLRSM